MVTPSAWLTEQPLQAGERLYLVISKASEADALTALSMSEPTRQLLPIWGDTPYATWHGVMPYVTELSAESAFLPWIAETDALDWGWLAVSRSDPSEVLERLRSLTQVNMPGATAVFFRFWDGRHLHPLLKALGDAAWEILPVFERYLINGNPLAVKPGRVPEVKDWPWWEVPRTLLATLAQENPTTRIDSLMHWLEDQHLDLYTAWPEGNLRLKVARIVGRQDVADNLELVLLEQLQAEQR
ncbi:DUF4123 domain-containing protein [Pseudomonas citri]|uniref:DUF4123 domain-containing protein n=1 Tax=Pseudomonas citri TaxID=2978349 RepID=UPI0021B5D1A0|nr:DUF4123 domain-containing protein [Pseudomonas citri]